jgi:hypothetical protein
LRAKYSQTEITALGNLPNAVIREPVTSSVGHGVFSGIVGPLRLAFLLLDVGQFLYLIRLCALAGSVAAFCLSCCAACSAAPFRSSAAVRASSTSRSVTARASFWSSIALSRLAFSSSSACAWFWVAVASSWAAWRGPSLR